MGESGCLCLSFSCNSGTSGHQVVGPKMSYNDPDCARTAQHAMVLGTGQHVSANSPLENLLTIQSVSVQGSPQPESTCLAAGFSNEVATRTEAPQRRSTRAVYESKWTVFVRWCEKNKVDFRSPSI